MAGAATQHRLRGLLSPNFRCGLNTLTKALLANDVGRKTIRYASGLSPTPIREETSLPPCYRMGRAPGGLLPAGAQGREPRARQRFWRPPPSMANSALTKGLDPPRRPFMPASCPSCHNDVVQLALPMASAMTTCQLRRVRTPRSSSWRGRQDPHLHPTANH